MRVLVGRQLNDCPLGFGKDFLLGAGCVAEGRVERSPKPPGSDAVMAIRVPVDTAKPEAAGERRPSGFAREGKLGWGLIPQGPMVRTMFAVGRIFVHVFGRSTGRP